MTFYIWHTCVHDGGFSVKNVLVHIREIKNNKQKCKNCARNYRKGSDVDGSKLFMWEPKLLLITSRKKRRAQRTAACLRRVGRHAFQRYLSLELLILLLQRFDNLVFGRQRVKLLLVIDAQTFHLQVNTGRQRDEVRRWALVVYHYHTHTICYRTSISSEIMLHIYSRFKQGKLNEYKKLLGG